MERINSQMKRTALAILCFLIIGIAFPLHASADVGPKSSVVVDFKGLDGEIYYATLLSSTETTGPYRVADKDNPRYDHNVKEERDHEVFDKFIEYEDNDGFYFIQYLENCSETHRLSWGYHPPYEFKILLYFPNTDTFVVSEEIYEKYAFDSYFTANVSLQNVDLAEQSEMTVTKSYNYWKEILSLIIRIIITIAIELGIALLFGLRSRNVFKSILIINIITQITLNIALNFINYYQGSLVFFLWYILLEIFVFATEAIIYTIVLKGEASTRRLVLFALVANLVSFLIGVQLAFLVPLIF